MKYHYLNNKKEEKILNNYHQFFNSINNHNKNIYQKNNDLEIKANVKQISFLRKGYNVFLTFSKDVIVGSSLFIVASIGLGSIAMINQMASHHKTYTYSTPNVEITNSTIYENFSLALKNNTTTEDLVLQLKQNNALNTIGKIQIQDSVIFESPLSQAVRYKRLDTVKQLVDSGADVNLIYDDTPILLSRIHNPLILNFNSSNLNNDLEEIKITMYLMSKGFNWKTNNFYILTSTANSELWRNFWINYLSKNDPKFLPAYKEILISQLNNKDKSLIDELKWIDNNKFK